MGVDHAGQEGAILQADALIIVGDLENFARLADERAIRLEASVYINQIRQPGRRRHDLQDSTGLTCSS